MSCIGQSVPRIDGKAKVRGSARYAEDCAPDHCLVVKVLRSTVAHGRVTRIDPGEARKMPGVRLVLTYEDVPETRYPTSGHPLSLDPSLQDIEDKRILDREVRYYGDEIAAVVADDEILAGKALERIAVEYEAYPPLLSAAEALGKDSREIHQGSGNIVGCTERNFGDYESVCQNAELSLEGLLHTQTVQHCHMETQAAWCYMDEADRLVFVTPSQNPFTLQRVVAHALELPWHRVRIVKPCVGGAFGSKQDPVVEPLLGLVCLKLHGHPVKFVYTREESFISRVRHAYDMHFLTHFNGDGTIVASKLDLHSINGAYASHGHAVAEAGMTAVRQIYQYRALRCQATTVYTNMPPAGAMRSYGVTQAVFGLESHIDDIAGVLGMDPLDLRLKNINTVGYTDPVNGVHCYTTALRECLETGRRETDWDQKRARYAGQTGPVRRGIGMAAFCYQSNTNPVQLEISGARISLRQDGRIHLQVGAIEIGQGSDTALLQIAADTIGVPPEGVCVTTEQDTDTTPFDLGAYASRQTYVAGLAVHEAARTVRRKILEVAARITHVEPDAADIRAGAVVLRDSGALLVTLEEVARHTYYHKHEAEPITCDITNRTDANALSYGCTFVELEVDMEVGRVQVLDIHNIHDAGRIINPALAQGQVHGGVSMGLGFALYEELRFDPETGRPLNANLLDYKLMTAADTPEIRTTLIETNEPTAPKGNKALGEPPTITQAPAVRNAILHATGVGIRELPLSPQKLFEAFRENGLV